MVFALNFSFVFTSEGLNKVQLLGRVGNHPKEFTSPTTGKKLVAFALATGSTYRTKDSDGNGNANCFLLCNRA